MRTDKRDAKILSIAELMPAWPKEYIEYTTKQVAELMGKSKSRINHMIDADKNPDSKKKHFPNIRRCKCGHGWLIPDIDLTNKIKV